MHPSERIGTPHPTAAPQTFHQQTGLNPASPDVQAAAEEGYAPVADPQKLRKGERAGGGPMASNEPATEAAVTREIERSIRLLETATTPYQREAGKRLRDAINARNAQPGLETT